jgi:hypothetical protein
MAMIKPRIALTWYAPTRGRRYFSKRAAINAEATAMILKKYPVEPWEEGFSHGYDIRVDETERFNALHSRVCRMLNRQMDKEKS